MGAAAAAATAGACQRQQQQQQQEQQARAQLRTRGVRVPSGCMCARMWRSAPQPSPAVSAYTACQPVQSAQYCARSGM
eukprot:6204530-Prymnesium_polylepis.1